MVSPGCDGGDIRGGQLWAGMKVTRWRGGEAPGGCFGSRCILSGGSEPVVGMKAPLAEPSPVASLGAKVA